MENQIIPLNIVMTYPVRWSKYKVFRDYIQNFYDSVDYREWKEKFHYTYENEKLSMWVDGVTFSYEWLLHIGASTKTTDKKNGNAGYFGEGFKVASLCAHRDFNWNIQMSSGDWNLDVVTVKQTIDQTEVEMLAYDVKSKEKEETSRLELNPVSEEEGAVFCAYQLRGSNPFGLSICLHDYEQNDRERSELYAFEITQILGEVASFISPSGAVYMLERMRRYWNSTPKKIDLRSWAPVIRMLISNISRSHKATELFRKKYPNLLCLPPIYTISDRNRRAQARAWLKRQEKEYMLVQISFELLHYPTLEEKCEENGEFVQDDEPDKRENQCIQILEQVIDQIYPDFFCFDKQMPERKIIQNLTASYHGMAKLEKRREAVSNSHGILIRNTVNQIYLKRTVLRKEGYFDALSTYVHESCHMFGGDASQAFSLGLTLAMELLLSHYSIVEKYKTEWEKLFGGNGLL
ncbi:MAG: hypothetical protein ACI4HI_18235 [Lachnospiraceae bacterium]